MKKIKYKFGCMSTVWEMFAENINIAKMAMSVFLERNIPIAIYEPDKEGFMPMDAFKKYSDNVDPLKVKKAIDSIKCIKWQLRE